MEKKTPAEVLQCDSQASTPLPDVDVTAKGDSTTSIDPVSDALDLSVKASGAVDDCTTGEDLAPSSDRESRLVCMRENKEQTIRPSPSASAGSIFVVSSTRAPYA